MHVVGTARQESAVAAVTALEKVNVRIGENARAGFWQETDEWIVFGRKDERGNGHTVDDACARGAIVVVVGIAEVAVACDDFLIELADGANGADAVDLINGGKEFGLVTDAAPQVAQKMPLISAVGGFVQSVGAGREINGRAHRGDRGKRWQRAPLAGELEHEISAHGIADQRNAREAEARREVAHHGTHVGRATRVIERRREGIAAAAVAHIHADNVHARGESARGYALHVAGIGRALEAVHQHRSEPRSAFSIGQPVAVAEDAATIGGIDFHGFSDGGQAKRRPGKKVADDSLQMAVGKPARGFEGSEPVWSFRRSVRGGTPWHYAGWHGA